MNVCSRASLLGDRRGTRKKAGKDQPCRSKSVDSSGWHFLAGYPSDDNPCCVGKRICVLGPARPARLPAGECAAKVVTRMVGCLAWWEFLAR
jgi:hypothetical protein